MNYASLIEQRKSTREFKSKVLIDRDLNEIREYFNEAKRLLPDVHVEMQIFTGDAKNRLEGVAGYMGKAFQAPAYLILLSEKADHAGVNAGYICEDMVLKLTEMEIDNCWVTVNDSETIKRALLLKSDLDVMAIIACGLGKPVWALKRLDIRTPSDVTFVERAGHIAPKIAQEELVYRNTWGTAVDWNENSIDPLLDQAFYAASLAPSFLNRQPYRYIYRPHQVILCVKVEEMTTEDDTALDLGATMLNFTSVFETRNSSNGKWTFGTPDDMDSVGVPKEWLVVAHYDF